MAEFAIVVPLLLLLLVGVVEFGSAWRSYQVVTNTAREGARITVVANQASYEEVRDEISHRLTGGGLDPDLATVEIHCETGVDDECFNGAARGESTEVRISYPYTFLFLRPIANWVGGNEDFPGSVTMATAIVMRNE